MAKKKWSDLGTLRKKEGGKAYLVIGNNVKILVGTYNKESDSVEDYEEVDLGEYRTVALTDPFAGIDGLLSKGYIDEKEANSRIEKIKDKNVKYKVTVPPLD